MPSTREVDDETQKILQEQAGWTLDKLLTHEAISSEVLGDASRVEEHLHLDYLRLQSQVNSITSPCPTYLDTCGRLGIDPLEPILPFLPGTKIPPRLSKLQRRLKPWQVQFLAWA